MTESQRDYITHKQPQLYALPWRIQPAPLGGYPQIVDAQGRTVPIYCGGNTPDNPGAQERQIVDAVNNIEAERAERRARYTDLIAVAGQRLRLRDDLAEANTQIANLREDAAAAHEMVEVQRGIIAGLQERLRGDEPTGEGWQRIVGMLRKSRKVEALSDADLFNALIELWSVHPIDSLTSCILDEVAKRGFPAQWNALAGEVEGDNPIGVSAAAGVSPSPRPAAIRGEEALTGQDVDASSTLCEHEAEQEVA